MGRFLLGFLIGAAIGIAAVLLSTPRNAAGQRRGLSELLKGALEAGRQASSVKEQEMWSDFHARVEEASRPQPKIQPPAPWESYER